ncbi:MAG: polyprenyl diphosphate synthase [Flavobacteriales bacterium]
MSVFETIDPARVPKHVAVIMDGNGRWAESQGKERIFGHFNGVEAVRATLKAATRCGVQYLTLYAFSTENWNRPKEEVDALMDLLVYTIVGELDELDKNEVRLWAIGDLPNLPEKCRLELEKGMDRTAHHKRINLVLALSYSAHWEITEAVKSLVREGLTENEITPQSIASRLSTHNLPDPELLIRTSGESRISNFLLWQIAYSELYFTDTFWPDFREEDFFKAIHDYQKRERRFGLTAAQIENDKNT